MIFLSMTPLQVALRNAFYNALADVDVCDFPELAEVRITLSNIEEEKEINISLVYDGDEKAYRVSGSKIDIHPYILGEIVDLTLEGDL